MYKMDFIWYWELGENCLRTRPAAIAVIIFISNFYSLLDALLFLPSSKSVLRLLFHSRFMIIILFAIIWFRFKVGCCCCGGCSFFKLILGFGMRVCALHTLLTLYAVCACVRACVYIHKFIANYVSECQWHCVLMCTPCGKRQQQRRQCVRLRLAGNHAIWNSKTIINQESIKMHKNQNWPEIIEVAHDVCRRRRHRSHCCRCWCCHHSCGQDRDHTVHFTPHISIVLF